MPIRCLENRVYAITANRTGEESRKEGQTLRFIGQSLIASPEGKVLTRASENDEVLLISEVNPETARNKSLNSLNDIFEWKCIFKQYSYPPFEKGGFESSLLAI
jgi:predicted amidohydrolase